MTRRLRILLLLLLSAVAYGVSTAPTTTTPASDAMDGDAHYPR